MITVPRIAVAQFMVLLFALYALAGVASGQRIDVYPERLQIGSPHQLHRILVVTTDETGLTRDVSREAQFEVSDTRLAAMETNVVHPLNDGEATVKVTLGDFQASVPLVIRGVAQRAPVSFQLDVMPVFTKSGCNTGTCHGSARGQDGFRLSLFGFDPAGDYQRITREMGARRVNLALPEQSLLLEKATGSVPHTGGLRLEAESDPYRTIYDWIREGAHGDAPDVAHAVGIELFPPEAVLQGADSQQQLLVLAHYSDETTRDVSRLAVFLSRNERVASVADDGVVTAGNRGESFVTARFGAFTEGIPVVVLPAESQFVAPPVAGNYVDELVQAKLTKLHFEPAPLCTDEAFLRRVYIDVCGRLPTIEERDTFLGDPSSTKRADLVDALLARPEFTDLWTNTWADLLLIKSIPNIVSRKSAFRYFQWLRDEMDTGTRWDDIVRQLMTATGSTFESPATGFYAAERNRLKTAENVAQAFLGIRIQCAQCHNHPFDRWTMDDYYGFAAFFAKVARKQSEDIRESIVFSGGGQTKHPVSGQTMLPKYLGGEVVEKPPGDPRGLVAEWLTAAENPYFANNVANRLWSMFFGHGIVEPVDDVRISNPPVNGPLYEELGRRLVEYEFAIRRLARDILNSHAYQRSAFHSGNTALTDNFGKASFRRIPASILLDCIDQVTESPSRHNAVPEGTKAVQLPGAADGNYFLKTFGRSSRSSVCACETKSDPTLSQALHLINGQSVHDKIQAGQIVKSMLDEEKTPAEIVDNIYVRCLSRSPTEKEREKLLAKLGDETNHDQERLEDVFWAVLNSREFLFNH